ncbi:uncharacterized protein [Centruroides vittatus]|uniref:uncharacterized protein n=1 Tax=Centruroides vittatus TaxID=120091 RepID=UPI00350ED198
MCKHQSGGMNKSPATNDNSGFNENNTGVLPSSQSNNYAAKSINECNQCMNATNERINFTYKENMAIGSHAESSSSSDKGYDAEQAEIQCNNRQNNKNKDEELFKKWCEQSNTDVADYDDHISEKSPMLQNQELSDMLPATSSWHNYQLSQISDDDHSIKSTRSGSGSEIPTTSLHNTAQISEYHSDCDKNSVNAYLQFQDELEPLFRPSYDCILIDNDIKVNNNIKSQFPGTSSHNSSLVQNWLFGEHQKYLADEVCVHKSCVSRSSISGCTSMHKNEDSQTINSIDNESFIGSNNSDLLTNSSINTVPKNSISESMILERPNSIQWEINNLREGAEFQSRSFSLSPTVNFAVYDVESSSEADDVAFSTSKFQRNSIPQNKQEIMNHSVILPGSSSTARLSLASSFSDHGGPICKICHTVGRDDDPLISPCRCSGTMQYIHCGCLMRWLEISCKRSRKPPSCELCQYQYHWHKKFKVRHWQFPHCSRRDITLHIMFFLSVIVMIACATITILCFKRDKGTKIDPDRTELNDSEITTFVCGILFFLAFFVGMYVEIKARNTIYKLLVKFVYLNQQWYIDEYNKKENIPVSV